MPWRRDEDQGIDVSLETPEKIRNLRKGLYGKAKAEPAFRFYLLYDKVYREESWTTRIGLPAATAAHRGWTG